MARSKFGARGMRRIARRTGIPVAWAFTRGGTHNRVDIYTPWGRVYHWWPKSGEKPAEGEMDRGQVDLVQSIIRASGIEVAYP